MTATSSAISSRRPTRIEGRPYRRGLVVSDVNSTGPAYRKLFEGATVLYEVINPGPRHLLHTTADLDAVLLEDRTPLVVKGMDIKPVATNRFKKSENLIMYSEIYEPLLLGENPPKVVFGYNILDRATNQQVMTTGSFSAEDFIHKGSPVIPVGLLVKVSDLKPGQYRLVLMAMDATGQQAANRTADFDVIE